MATASGDNVRKINKPADDDAEVDLDLDAEDARLREAVGKPTTVRIDGKVISVDHAASWSNAAMRAATSGDWNTWATEVIADEKQLQAFLDANLVNYQLEAIFAECGKAAQMSMGKSQRALRSSRNTQRR